MNLLCAYRRERLPLRRFGPLALIIAHLGAEPGRESLPRTALALLLIANFRVRDDLADRHSDALAHPNRALVRARSTRPLVLALVAGTSLAFVGLSLLRGTTRGLGLLVLTAAFELGYRLELPGRHRWVLLKYPSFAALLGDSLPPTLAGLCYLALAVHERLDDEGLRSRPDADLRLAAYLLATAALVVVHLHCHRRSGGGRR